MPSFALSNSVRRLSALTVLLLLSASLSAATKKVIVISIDGLRGITLASLSTRGLHTPNLNEFAQGGALADGLIGVYPTVTYPSHTTLVTGVSPNQHGILCNVMFDPEHEFDGAWYWYAQQIKRPTLYTIAKEKGLTTGAVSWPVTVDAHIDYNFPEYREPDTQEGLLLYGGLCTQGLLAAYEKANAPLQVNHVDDEVRAAMARYLITTYKPDLLFVHLIDMDHQQHVHGPDSPEAFKTLENIDRLIGTIREAVKTSEPGDEVDYVIVSDHGFRPTEKQLNPNAVLTSLGLEGTKDAPEKWRISAFDSGASFGLVAHDPNDAEAIKTATEAFKQLAAQDRWGIEKFYTAAETHALGGYSNSFASVSMQSGFLVGAASSGPWLTDTKTRGMHGYAPGPKELDASFLAFGPGIPHRHLPRAKLVDVAPTVAHILNLPMPDVEGHDLLQ
jgi:predicted AlkP superfamily pyrophosphatase or phosphodiesterase